MFTLTKDGNLSKDGKETKPEMTVQEFMDTFGVPKSKLDEEDGAVFYDTEDSFNGVPCKVEFCFYNDRIMDVQIIISTEPFLDKCDDIANIQDFQRDECLKLIEKNVKYREKDTDGRWLFMYTTKNSEIVVIQREMNANLTIKIEYC